MQENCCKRFQTETWQQLKAKPNREVADEIQEATDWDNVKQVPAVLHDFGQPPRGDDQPQDPFYGLLMLRRNLANAAAELHYRLRFPLYDFACVWYLHQKNRLSLEKLNELFPAEEIDCLIEIADAVSGTSLGAVGKAVLAIFSKHLGQHFLLSLQQRRLKEDEVRQIRQMDAETELINELPRLFAQDLNAAMSQPQAPERIVLFFDTHEAFWGEQRNLQGDRFFIRDEWLRYLLAELELSSGIVAVVAGREPPRWHQATRWKMDREFLDTQLVYHLSATDADTYLQQEGIGIADADLRRSLIAYASVEPNQVHPLLLGLCADVVLKARDQGITLTPADFITAQDTAEKTEELIKRLLKYVDRQIEYAVHALSACLTFDFELYCQIGEKTREFHPTKADFDILKEFSFIRQTQRRGQDWYRIHDLLRRLDYERGNEITIRTHAVLEQHYREGGKWRRFIMLTA